MFSSKNIAVIASIMIIGIGGNYAFGGNIPFFGIQVPCIAGAAIFGILLNLLLSIGEKKQSRRNERCNLREKKEIIDKTIPDAVPFPASGMVLFLASGFPEKLPPGKQGEAVSHPAS